jgi:hypothetical protein
MSLFDKADFVGTHVISSAAQRDFILSRSNNKGHQHFAAMAEFGDVTSTPQVLSLAAMLQTYILDAAAVDKVLQANGSGLRGHDFLSAVTFAGDLTPAGVISAAAGTSADPHTLTLTGWFSAGLTLDITYDTDVGTPGTAPLLLTEAMGPLEVAQLYGDYLKGPDGLTTTIADNVITFLPYPPAVQVTMSGFTIV